MKFIRLSLTVLALSGLLFSCSKSGEDDDDPDCMSDNTTQVTFKNNGSTTLRVEVASQLTPQYEAINPVVTLDLAAGESVKKVFTSGRYMIIWKNGCPSNCAAATSASSRDFESCGEYEEVRGI